MPDITLKLAPEHADDILGMITPGLFGKDDQPQEGGPMPAGRTPVPMKPASDVPQAMTPPGVASAALGRIALPQGQDQINPTMSPASPERGRSALGKVGHALGEIGGYGLSAVMPHVASLIPSTPLGKIALENRDESLKEKESEIGSRNAQTGLEQEKVDIAKQNAQRTPVTDKQGNTYYLDQAGLDKYAVGSNANQTKSDIATAGNETKKDIASSEEQNRFDIEKSRETSAQMLQNGRPVSMDQLAARATQENDLGTLQKIQQYKEQIAKAGKQEPGNFVAVNDAQGNTMGWANPKSRDWVPVSGITGVGEAASGAGGTVIPPKPNPSVAAGNKSAQESLAFAEDYGKNGTSKGPDGKPVYTGAGDEALMEQYFNLAKPSSGFRMNQSQMDMLIRSRAWMQSAEGITYHAENGVWFPPDQRDQIIHTMEQLGKSKGVSQESTKPSGGSSGVIKLARGPDGKLKAQ